MKLQLPGKKTRYWQVFWLCLLAAAALFAPHCLVDAVAGGGYFHYAGDFYDQQIIFYQYANSFIKQGGSFSWATDLGSGFVNSYSFYLLGSPFFWLTLLVPARFMPWMMVPLLCLKIALAGGGGYLWVRRWVRDEDWSMLAGCLYAFSGFTVYNIFFNHFLDVVALFPYMLAALDGAGLTPYLLQYIHKQKTSPATFVLIEARKGAHAKPSVAEPIALYGPERFFTLESLAFCPFLR